MIRPVILSCFIILSALLVTPHAYAQKDGEEEQTQQPESRIFIAEMLSRYIPGGRFEMMEPATINKTLLIPSNPHYIPSRVTLTFKEANNVYGFPVLICDEENTELYFDKRPAECDRYQIDSPEQIVSFTSDGRHNYYLIVMNKAVPVPVTRTITVNAKSGLFLPQDVKDRTKQVLLKIMSELKTRHDTEPLNFAIVPCEDTYIPSNPQTRTLTLCSDLILGDTLAPDQSLLMMTLFYELAPILLDDWELPAFSVEEERIRFALSLFMTFIDSNAPLDYYYDTLEATPQGDDVWQRMQMEGRFTFYDRLKVISTFLSNPNKENDHWMRIIYAHMTDETLRNIKDKKLHHYGARRNEARMILNDREGF